MLVCLVFKEKNKVLENTKLGSFAIAKASDLLQQMLTDDWMGFMLLSVNKKILIILENLYSIQ